MQFTVTRQWLLAGKAICTVKSPKGGHYTYKVSKADDADRWFVSLLTGPDNTYNYTYLGMLQLDMSMPATIRLTGASKLNADSTPVKVAAWAFWHVLLDKPLPPGYSVDGEGRCGRCGRPLTHPDGIANDGYRLGFGAKCWGKMMGE